MRNKSDCKIEIKDFFCHENVKIYSWLTLKKFWNKTFSGYKRNAKTDSKSDKQKMQTFLSD